METKKSLAKIRKEVLDKLNNPETQKKLAKFRKEFAISIEEAKEREKEKILKSKKARFIKRLLGVFTREQAELLWHLFQGKANKDHDHPVWRA